MKTPVGDASAGTHHQPGLAVTTKTRLRALLQVLVVYGLVQALLAVWYSVGISQREVPGPGWPNTRTLILVGIPILAVCLTRRSRSLFGMSCADWRRHPGVGMKAYLVRLILVALAWGNDLLESVLWGAGLALMAWLLSRHESDKPGHANVMATVLLLLLPICAALATGGLSVGIASTIAWQFALSGFVEECVSRG